MATVERIRAKPGQHTKGAFQANIYHSKNQKNSVRGFYNPHTANVRGVNLLSNMFLFFQTVL
jgi:hypothetical protein